MRFRKILQSCQSGESSTEATGTRILLLLAPLIAPQQGQGAAQSQTEGPKAAKLSSAIRRELYRQFDGTTSFTPQMREMFPDRSTQSLENVVQEKGVQLPDSMINADGQNELLSGLTDNRMYQYNQQVAEVNKLLNLIADRQLGR